MCVNACGVVSVNVITTSLKMCAFCVIVSSKKSYVTYVYVESG